MTPGRRLPGSLIHHGYGVIALLFVSSLTALLRAEVSGPQGCQARVLVALTDDLGNTWKAGSVLPVDIKRDSPNGGALCAHGGSCLPRRVGAQPVLMLLNCTVGPEISEGDSRLVPDPRLAGPAAAAKLQTLQDTTDKLMNRGFSNASAGSLAHSFVNDPRSRTGRLVAKALGGSQTAVTTLKRHNP